VFQTIAYSYPLRKAIADEWLVPITPWVIETTTSLDQVRTTAGDFNQKQLAEAVNTQARNTLAVTAWREYAERCSTIAFTVDVAHAHDLATEFRKHGIPAEMISGETPKEDRRQILRRYTEGTVEVITNCMVLTEGTDLPRTSCILHAKPTQSATLYEQMTGRGLRLYPDKRACIVLDIVDVAKRHSLQTAPVLYGLPPGLMLQGKKLEDVKRELEALVERYPGFVIEENAHLTLEQLRAKASTFDVWAVPSLGAFGHGRKMDWIRVATDEYRLQYPWGDGTEVLTVSKDLLGHFAVSLTLRPRDGSPPRQRTLATQVTTSNAAAGLAEAFILQERRSVMKLRGPEADWHSDPPTEKQIAILQRIGAPLHRHLTKGEASRMISLHQARRGR
jgi:ATP-dependent helicase IRC3